VFFFVIYNFKVVRASKWRRWFRVVEYSLCDFPKRAICKV